MKIINIFLIFVWGLVAVSVVVLVVPVVGDWFDVNYLILTKSDFVVGGVHHKWYIAPMQGLDVVLFNGSVYSVHTDYWDSCEHNPDQGHLIGVGYFNKTLADERNILDKNPMTRDYGLTNANIIWVNASLVEKVIFH